MVRLLAVLFFAAFATFAAPASAQTAPSDDEAIRAAVLNYFHGQGAHDRQRLRQAFARDNATMVSVMPNQQGVDTVRTFHDMNEMIDTWVGASAPPDPNRDGEILEVHILDGRIATVFFRYTRQWYDALTLTKINGEWKIVSRVFIRQTVNTAR